MIRRRTALADLSDLTDLALLDPAGPSDPGAATTVPALALLERVLASPRQDAPGAPGSPVGRPTRYRAPRPTGRRLALTGATVAVLAVAGVVLPSLGDRAADAAWTAVPGRLDRQETLDAAEECREVWRANGDGEPPTATLAGMVPLVAEHRGDVDLVVIGDGRWVGSCLLDETGSAAALQPPDSVAAAAAPPVDGVAWRFAAGSLTEDGTWLVAVAGRVGADVAAVTLHPEHGGEGVSVVHATLQDGWLVAFWPSRADRAATDPMDTPLTLTLRTGEVLRDVVVPWE